MIEFKSKEHNDAIFINPALVGAVTGLSAIGITRIYVCSQYFDVGESVTEVLRKLES